MRQEYKKRNSPRRANAITQAITYLRDTCGWWGYFHYSDRLGELIWQFGFKADKYDVLNSLVCVERNKIVTFCRRDIRHSFDRYKLFCDWILALVIFHLLVSLLITLCY